MTINLAHLERAESLGRKMLDARATLRGFWGTEYEAKIEPARDLIRKIQARIKGTTLQSALMIAQYYQGRGEDFNVLANIAAAADLCEAEPSTRRTASHG